MQPFMHDQPQPACSSVEHNSTQRADADYYRPKEKGFEKRSFWIGCKHLPSSLWRGGGGFGLDARASVISSVSTILRRLVPVARSSIRPF
jgi:hypothetical protein